MDKLTKRSTDRIDHRLIGVAVTSTVFCFCEAEARDRNATEPVLCVGFEENVLAFGIQVDR